MCAGQPGGQPYTPPVQTVAATETTVHSRALRFLAVTCVTASLGQMLIFVFFALLGWSGLAANATAVACVAVVGLFLSLRFVWRRPDGKVETNHVVMYFVMTAIGLVLSSITVELVTSRLDSILAANIGSIAGYGLAWGLRFIVLDRLVFNDTA